MTFAYFPTIVRGFHAGAKDAPIHSAHQGYTRLLKSFGVLWDFVLEPPGENFSLLTSLAQIAADAAQIAEQLNLVTPDSFEESSEFSRRVSEQLAHAREKFPPIANLEEAYAVLLEEREEFWAYVRMPGVEGYGAAMLGELVQIAAMAQRSAEDLGLIQAEGGSQ